MNNVQQLIHQKNIYIYIKDHWTLLKINFSSNLIQFVQIIEFRQNSKNSQISDISINSRRSFHGLLWDKRFPKRLWQIPTSQSGILSKFRVNSALIVLGRQSIRMWQTTHASHVTVTPSTWRILDQVGVEQCDVARIAGPLTLSCCFGGAAWEASLILSILRLFSLPPQLHLRC